VRLGFQPILCLVTNRLRLAERWGEAPTASTTLLVEQVGAAASAGVDLVHVRERDLPGGPLTALVGDLRRAVASTTCRILVNDRVDVAVATGAAGVHLRADSCTAAEARTLVGEAGIVGRSLHTRAEARALAADDALDYVMFGTVFASASKPSASPAGLEELRAIVGNAGHPVLAIGGIDTERARLVARAGAAGLAGIDLFIPPVRVEAAAALHGIVDRVRHSFDGMGADF
jgi:thiamine-phosphate diphosphorylase